ncbi:hypothetical protein BABINDRAFT_9424 [Babjeviella inositovora NRRL Y-12698]|uniref:Cytochrome c oxidase subunit IV n=1 Tax=Babjeviella inositovora NRRL Y-12698 TaxID=984486 RepID=A0A1E3QKG3_9ASCO|nr:uncharacterized protein BABINDRAFT_9424 [Babjeviella inositovora NRRL Y-12698]ODQ78196.1 hypothetical protein BABINDRAFT_9424 [Babjeviella inositovora NRRL Y-12698]
MFRQALRTLPHAPKFAAVRLNSTVAVKPLSKALIGGIEQRFETLAKADQNEIVESLAKRQQGSWSELTKDEKRAIWFIHYGPYGPRKPLYTAEDKVWIAKAVVISLAFCGGLYAFLRSFAAPPPKTMTREWQEASDEYLKSKNAEPFSGYSQVQSK